MTKALTTFRTVRDLFSSQKVQEQLMMALPNQIKIDRLVRVSLSVMRQNNTLMQCTEMSLLACLVGSAQLDLSPEPFLGQVYFVPYKVKGVRQATLIPGYRGYITLAQRSGQVASLSARVVHTNDQFEIRYGVNEDIIHVPNEASPGNFRGAYCVFRYTDPQLMPSFEYMPKIEIEKIRNVSKAKDSGPWVDWYEEMAKKTPIRRHIKMVPLSVEDNRLAQAAAAEDAGLMVGGDQQSLFLPDEGPLVVESREGEWDEAVYYEWIREYFKDDEIRYVQQFIATAAAENSISVTEVKQQALKTGQPFIDQCKRYIHAQRQAEKATTETSGPPPVDPINQKTRATQPPPEQPGAPTFDAENNFIDEWVRLRPQGFHKYVLANKLRFAQCNPDTLKKARKKYQRLYNNPAEFDKIIAKAKRMNGGAGAGMGQGEISQPAASQGAKSEQGMAKLMESDEWQELMALSAQYPDLYKQVVMGTPRSMAEVVEAIGKIDTLVDKAQQQAGQSKIPGA